MMYYGISNRDYFIIKVIFSQYNIIVILFTLGRQCCSEEGINSGELLWSRIGIEFALVLWGRN
ncbi:MAG: hypothetical protein KBC30_11445 [Planctomycetes bacterium]|nr:hypothetical protein [Planctomycetota bacterium]